MEAALRVAEAAHKAQRACLKCTFPPLWAVLAQQVGMLHPPPGAPHPLAQLALPVLTLVEVLAQ